MAKAHPERLVISLHFRQHLFVRPVATRRVVIVAAVVLRGPNQRVAVSNPQRQSIQRTQPKQPSSSCGSSVHWLSAISCSSTPYATSLRHSSNGWLSAPASEASVAEAHTSALKYWATARGVACGWTTSERAATAPSSTSWSAVLTVIEQCTKSSTAAMPRTLCRSTHASPPWRDRTTPCQRPLRAPAHARARRRRTR